MPRGGKRPGAGRKPGRKTKYRAEKREPSPRPVAAAGPPPVPFAVIVGGDGRLLEPDWSIYFADELDVAIARSNWSTVTHELRDTEKLAPANAHHIFRLICNYVLHAVALRHVAEEGAVFPRKGRKQPAYNPWWTVLKDTNGMASAAEAELTITPRRRNNGGKVKPKAKRIAASDEFLHSIPGGSGNAVGKKGG